MPFYFYFARCSDGSLYAGSCKDLSAREKKHNDGTGAKYTRSRGPVKIVYSEEFRTYPEALRREAQVKTWRKVQKEELVGRKRTKKRVLSVRSSSGRTSGSR